MCLLVMQTTKFLQEFRRQFEMPRRGGKEQLGQRWIYLEPFLRIWDAEGNVGEDESRVSRRGLEQSTDG
jgi:hypothetical protein